MRILMVTYRFPPYNSIGAVRCGKMAKYLTEFGHDVKVISCENQPLSNNLKIEIPIENVHYASWWNINAPVERLLGGREKIVKTGVHSAVNKPGLKSKILKFMGKLYKDLLHIPDAQLGWKKAAIDQGLRVIREWSPDVIYASAHPITSFVVANELSVKSNIPWIGELRDLWVDSPYYANPAWKKWFEEKWERRLFSEATALTTITEHAAEVVSNKYDCPVEVILNGYDKGDFHPNIEELPMPQSFIKDGINILYAGMIYPGKRDPKPLLEAVSLLPEGLRKKVKLHFYGTQLNVVNQVAEELAIKSCVAVNSPIPYNEILTMQQQSDLLLLLMWNDPAEKGTFTGKFFEYVGAKRQILCVGGQDSPPAKVIRERKLGKVLFDPEEIAVYLSKLIKDKEDKGFLENTPDEAGAGFSRKEQAEKLSIFLEKIIK